MELIIKKNNAGCWYDGSHQSADNLNWATIKIMNRIIEKAYDDEKLLFDSNDESEFLYGTAEQAINFVNSEICGDSKYSESPELFFEVYDNSLFLTNESSN